VGSIAASAGGGVVGYQAAFVGMTVVAAAMLALGFALKTSGTQQPLDSEPATTRP